MQRIAWIAMMTLAVGASAWADGGVVAVGSTKIITLAPMGSASVERRVRILQARLVDILTVLREGDDPEVMIVKAEGRPPVLYAKGLPFVTVTNADARLHNSTPIGLALVWQQHLDTVLRAIAPTEIPTEIRWLTDFDEGMSIAAETGKRMMIDFTADWCGPCRHLDEQTWTDPGVIALAAQFVCIKVDIDSPRETARDYGIHAIPTVLFLEPDGGQIKRHIGFVGPEDMAPIMQDAGR